MHVLKGKAPLLNNQPAISEHDAHDNPNVLQAGPGTRTGDLTSLPVCRHHK